MDDRSITTRTSAVQTCNLSPHPAIIPFADPPHYLNKSGASLAVKVGQKPPGDPGGGRASADRAMSGVMPFLLMSTPAGVWYLDTVTATADPAGSQPHSVPHTLFWVSCDGIVLSVALDEHLRRMRRHKHLHVICKRSARPDVGWKINLVLDQCMDVRMHVCTHMCVGIWLIMYVSVVYVCMNLRMAPRISGC